MNKTHDVILGKTWFTAHDPVINWRTHHVSFENGDIPQDAVSAQTGYYFLYRVFKEPKAIKLRRDLSYLSLSSFHFGRAARSQVTFIAWFVSRCFTAALPDALPPHRSVEFEISMKHGAQLSPYIYGKPYWHIVTNVGSNKHYPSSSVHFVCCSTYATHIRLNFHVRCAHSTLVVLGLSTSTGLLPVKKSLALRHLQQILVLAMLTLRPRLKLVYLPAKPRDILTSFHHLDAKRTLFPLIRKLGKGILYPVILPI